MTVVDKWSDSLLFDELLRSMDLRCCTLTTVGPASADAPSRGRRIQLWAGAVGRSVDRGGRSTQEVSATGCEAAGVVGMELGRDIYVVCDDAFRSLPRGGSRWRR